MDKPKFSKEYKRLVNRVRAIDPAASCWMMNEAWKINRRCVLSGSLWGAFAWRETPQGGEYWKRIALALDKMEMEAANQC